MRSPFWIGVVGSLCAGGAGLLWADAVEAQPTINPPPAAVPGESQWPAAPAPRELPSSTAPVPSAAPAQPSSGAASSDAPAGGDMELDEAVRKRARLHFRLGVDFYREQDFRAALIEFRRAYEIAPHYTVLFNLGQTAIELKEYVLALDYLSRYLSSGADTIAPLRREEVEAMIKDLSARTGVVTVHADGLEGAELRLDNEVVGVLPLSAPVRASVGRREFRAVREGREVARKVVDVAAADKLDVYLELSAAAVPAMPAVVADGGANWPLIAAGVSTSVFVAAAGVMTYATYATGQRYEEVRTGDDPVSVGRFKNLRNLTKRMAWVTDGLYLASLLSGTATVVLWALDDDEERAEDKPGVEVGLAPDGIWMNGRF